MPRFALSALAFVLWSAPALAACKEEVTRFQKLLDTDLKVGHVGKSVHQKASGELEAANAQCKAGQDAAATATVRAIRVRYGYPAGSHQNLPQ